MSQGPVAVDWLKPGIERWLAADVYGGKARVGSASLVWSSKAQSLGLELSDVLLVDRKGRTVLKAASMGAGVSMPSMLLLDPAPGRVEARRFFAAISVSPQGKYGLGYEARGVPEKGGDLWRLFDDITGQPRRGRPLSFLREVDLEEGIVDFRDVDGPVSWRGAVTRVRYSKSSSNLSGEVDVSVGQARLTARGAAAVGLKSANADIQAVNFDPARILPSVGSTATLSALDALVQAKGSLSWAADRGVRAADVHVVAGAGQLRLNGSPDPFQAAELVASFDPRTQRVRIERASALAARADIDITGEVWLVPESRRNGPVKVEVALSAPNGRLALAPGAEPQAIDSFIARGRYIPKSGRLEIDTVRATIAGSPFQLAGTLQRPHDPRSWGVELDGGLAGPISPQELTAVWPNGLDNSTRSWLHDHVPGGRIANARFRVRLQPGALSARHALTESQLRLGFSFDGADVSIDSHIPSIEQGRGEGLLQGDRFEVTMTSGKVGALALSEGSYLIPRLMGPGRRIQIQGRAGGDAGELLQIVDRLTGGAATARGFEPKRLAGRADVRFSVGRPFAVAHPKDYVVGYSGSIYGAVLSDAALGMTLKSPSVSLQGALDRLSASGQVEFGPYRGPMQYRASFPDGRPIVQRADFNGLLDASSAGLSGPGGSTLKFAARIDGEGAAGKASIRSKAFDGQGTWNVGPHGKVVFQGAVDMAALRAVGVPVGKGLAARVPARLVLSQGPAGWAGNLVADAYSGEISIADGQSRRVRYSAQLNPAEAHALGLPPAPGGRSIPVLVDASTSGKEGAVSYSVGSWLGQINWAPAAADRTQYHWRETFSPDDLHALGLPSAIRPEFPLTLDATVTSSAGGLSGAIQSGQSSIRFSAVPGAAGRRRLTFTGGVDGDLLASMGLGAPGLVVGPAAVAGSLDLGPDGLRSGHLDADLQRAEVSAPFVYWKKPAGRAMRLSADFDKRADGVLEVGAIRGLGPGFVLAGSGVWQPSAQSLLRIIDARLEGAFDGSVDFQADSSGPSLTTRARYVDARRMIQQGQPAADASGSGPPAPSQPLRIDAQMAQVRLSESGLVRNVRVLGEWGEGAQRRLQITISRDDGAGLVDLKLAPATGGMAIDGQVSDVGEAAAALFGEHSLKGGKAKITGLQVDGGADLKVEMTHVRLAHAPWMARILTMGSLHGASDTMNGAGIEFTRVEAQVSLRGARMTIGRARATGPAMGVTTQGVIDIDNRTVDLQGGIAPSYALNSAVGAVPVVGDLLISKKGEGMFGLTYSARGAFASPKISVNPFSLATPGILRRIFEGRSAAALPAVPSRSAGG
jgi:hypothetical protein